MDSRKISIVKFLPSVCFNSNGLYSYFPTFVKHHHTLYMYVTITSTVMSHVKVTLHSCKWGHFSETKQKIQKVQISFGILIVYTVSICNESEACTFQRLVDQSGCMFSVWLQSNGLGFEMRFALLFWSLIHNFLQNFHYYGRLQRMIDLDL